MLKGLDRIKYFLGEYLRFLLCMCLRFTHLYSQKKFLLVVYHLLTISPDVFVIGRSLRRYSSDWRKRNSNCEPPISRATALPLEPTQLPSVILCSQNRAAWNYIWEGA